MTDAISKFNSIQNLEITDLCGHLLFISSVSHDLLAGVDDDDIDEGTSIAGVHDDQEDAKSDVESEHNSVYPNEEDDNSSKASIHSNSCQNETPVHSTNEED